MFSSLAANLFLPVRMKITDFNCEARFSDSSFGIFKSRKSAPSPARRGRASRLAFAGALHRFFDTG